MKQLNPVLRGVQHRLQSKEQGGCPPKHTFVRAKKKFRERADNTQGKFRQPVMCVSAAADAQKLGDRAMFMGVHPKRDVAPAVAHASAPVAARHSRQFA